MKEFEEVLTNIKDGKFRDPKGISRDIFKLNNLGTDLKQVNFVQQSEAEWYIPYEFCKRIANENVIQL